MWLRLTRTRRTPAWSANILARPLVALAPVKNTDPFNTKLAGGVPRNALDGNPGSYWGTELDLGVAVALGQGGDGVVVIVAVGVVARAVAAGTAAHSDHGRCVAEVFMSAARKETEAYKIKDVNKLLSIAPHFGVAVTVEVDGEAQDRDVDEIASRLAIGVSRFERVGAKVGDAPAGRVAEDRAVHAGDGAGAEQAEAGESAKPPVSTSGEPTERQAAVA